MKQMLIPNGLSSSSRKWILAIIFVSALPFQGIAQTCATEKPVEEKDFWEKAYEAAVTYLKDPSPQNAERFAEALPDKPRAALWPNYGPLRLSNLIFDFETRNNFSILEKNIEAGEPHAMDVGFRLINISDGLAGEELVFVLGRISDKHPRLFLQKLKAHMGKTQPDVLELLEAMMHPVAWWEQQEDEAGYPALLKKRLNIRIEALRSVKNKELGELRDRCLRILEGSFSAKMAIGGKIDRTIIREIDLNRDGKPEKMVLHLTGKDLWSPFTWTIEVIGGIDLVTVKEILRHATIQMTMRYAHPTPENKRKAVEVLADLFDKNESKHPGLHSEKIGQNTTQQSIPN